MCTQDRLTVSPVCFLAVPHGVVALGGQPCSEPVASGGCPCVSQAAFPVLRMGAPSPSHKDI